MPTTPLVSPKKFLTHQGENKLTKRLETILPKMRHFDCLVGYFLSAGFSGFILRSNRSIKSAFSSA